jgi:hypothetical protein
MFRAVLLGLVLAGCAKDLAQLKPFPCGSDDYACPSGFMCAGGKCYLPRLDGPCNATFDTCGSIDPTLSCVVVDVHLAEGFCERACGSGESCGDGHACSTPVGGVCVPSDTDSECGSDARDVGGLCIPGPSLADDPRCDSDLTCALRDPTGATFCYRGACVTACAGSACDAAHADAQHLCEPAGSDRQACALVCGANETCPSPLTCQSGVCVGAPRRANGTICSAGIECSSGACSPMLSGVRYCTQLYCTTDESCGTGYFCADGACFPTTPPSGSGCNVPGGSVGALWAAVGALVLGWRRRRAAR